MISILTNEGARRIASSVSGGTLFLPYIAALSTGTVTSVRSAAIEITKVEMDLSGNETRIVGLGDIVRRVPCSGMLPVQIKEGNVEAWAIDLDFNTQLNPEKNPDTGLPESVSYQSVAVLGRRYVQIRSAERGTVYKYGDHVRYGDSRNTVYTCIADNYEYAADSPSPAEDCEGDNAHWARGDISGLYTYPGNPSYYSDPKYDTTVMHITSYDEAMTLGNGIEFEYKVRIFLDNLTQDQISKIEKFALGTEANGSLTLSFMAIISEDFRKMRDMVSPMA